MHRKGAPLSNCWGFIDGTVRPIYPPGQKQRYLYNGHKRIHATKFQSIAAQNGLIANLYGSIEVKQHDSAMLVGSRLLCLIHLHCNDANGHPFYGIRTIAPKENCPPGRVRVWVRVRTSFTVRGQFSSGQLC